MYDKLIGFLKQKGWKYSEMNDGKIFLNLSGYHGVYNCLGYDQPEKKRFAFYSSSMVLCPEGLRSQMAELLMRFNTTVFNGSFELHFNTGEIRFKTTIFYEGMALTDDSVINNLITGNVFIIDDCEPSILGMIFEGRSVSEAFEIRTTRQQSGEWRMRYS